MTGRIIHEVRSADGWNGLLEGFRLAFDDLRISYATAGKLGGLADGHVEKLLAPIPVKNMGPQSFAALMVASGTKILFVRDEELFGQIAAHGAFAARKPGPTRHTSDGQRAVRRLKRRALRLSKHAAKVMRGRLYLLTTPKQRSAWAHTAGKASAKARGAGRPPSKRSLRAKAAADARWAKQREEK